jgi:hypothetical protein
MSGAAWGALHWGEKNEKEKKAKTDFSERAKKTKRNDQMQAGKL